MRDISRGIDEFFKWFSWLLTRIIVIVEVPYVCNLGMNTSQCPIITHMFRSKNKIIKHIFLLKNAYNLWYDFLQMLMRLLKDIMRNLKTDYPYIILAVQITYTRKKTRFYYNFQFLKLTRTPPIDLGEFSDVIDVIFQR